MRVAITRTETGKPIEITVSRPAGYVLHKTDWDAEEHRFVIASYVKSPGSPAGEDKLEFPFEPTNTGEKHSVTALVVVGAGIAARDRKRVRTGQTIA